LLFLNIAHHATLQLFVSVAKDMLYVSSDENKNGMRKLFVLAVPNNLLLKRSLHV